MSKRKNRNSKVVANLKRDATAKPTKFTLYTRNLNLSPSIVTNVMIREQWADAGVTNTTLGEFKPNTLLSSSDPYTNNFFLFPAALTNLGRNYAKYRVIGYRYMLDIVSRSASDYYLFVIDSAAATGITTGTITNSSTAVSSQFARMFTIPANTKSPCHVVVPWTRRRMINIIGSTEYETNDTYVGTSTTAGVFSDPADLIYLTLAASLTVPAAQTASNSPSVVLHIEKEVEFFDPRS